jgi:hypothetical protein
MSNETPTLAMLIGEEVSAVSFVTSYVEFIFNGPVLRAIAWPTLRAANQTYTFPEPGSRDALCALIGQVVRSVENRDGNLIRLSFASGDELTIPLDEASLASGEGAHFVPQHNGPIHVW